MIKTKIQGFFIEQKSNETVQLRVQCGEGTGRGSEGEVWQQEHVAHRLSPAYVSRSAVLLCPFRRCYVIASTQGAEHWHGGADLHPMFALKQRDWRCRHPRRHLLHPCGASFASVEAIRCEEASARGAAVGLAAGGSLRARSPFARPHGPYDKRAHVPLPREGSSLS